MNEKIKDYLGFVPYAVPVVYFLGFILISGYLSNFNYSDYNILNLTYLKAGILFTTLIVIIFATTRFSFNKETMTDDLTKSWKAILLVFHNILLVTYIILTYLIDFEVFHSKLLRTIFFVFIGLLLIFYFWTGNKTVKSNKGFLLLIIPGIIILSLINLLYAFNVKLAFYLLAFNLATSMFITISLGLFGDDNYYSKIVTDFIFLIVACFIFGSSIYGIIPFKIGGGESYKIIVNNNCLNKLSDTNPDTLDVIYENDRHFVIVKNDKTFVIDKNEIKCFYLLNKKLPPTTNIRHLADSTKYEDISNK